MIDRQTDKLGPFPATIHHIFYPPVPNPLCCSSWHSFQNVNLFFNHPKLDAVFQVPPSVTVGIRSHYGAAMLFFPLHVLPSSTCNLPFQTLTATHQPIQRVAGFPQPRSPILFQVFRVVSICLGNPPTTFCWEYYDKEKNYHKIGPISPAKFYQEHVKPLFDMESKVCLVNDPRPRNKYNQLYTVDYLGNMVGGRKTLYNNQPVELLKKMVAASIQDGEAVWFGCDVGKCFNSKLGINDLKIYNHELMFGVSVKNMKKDERLIFGDSMMTHAMVITAFTKKEEPDEGYEKWRVENSWGEDRGNKGYLLMTDDWFSEFVYEVVIDRKHVPEEVLEVLQQEPICLPAWDPMGALAH
uniref:Bleomycin hydrolase n=1 Tax=Laticauda laticaudata TaxID=8630 RepID=A0A8C5SRP8_LATLA